MRLVPAAILLCAAPFMMAAGADAPPREVPEALSAAFRRASKDGTEVVVLFTSRQCSFCKELAEVLPEGALAELVKPAVFLVAEQTESVGAWIEESYSTHSAPTLLFLRPDGSETDRIVGFRGADCWKAEIGRIRGGKDTLRSLEAAVLVDATDEQRVQHLVKLAESDPRRALSVSSSLSLADPLLRDQAALARARAHQNISELPAAIQVYTSLLGSESHETRLSAVERGCSLAAQVEPRVALEFLERAETLGDIVGRAKFDIHWRKAGLGMRIALIEAERALPHIGDNVHGLRYALLKCLSIRVVTPGILTVADTFGEMDGTTARDWLCIGRLHMMAGDPEAALRYFERSRGSEDAGVAAEAAIEIEVAKLRRRN